MNINDNFKYLNMELPEDIRRLKDAGYFKEAIRLIDIRMNDEAITDELKYCMKAHREMMKKIPENFTLSFDELLAQFKEAIPDFTKEELVELEDNRFLRWVFVEGEKRYFKRSYKTAIKSNLELAKRAGEYSFDPDNSVLGEDIKACKEKGLVSKRITFTRTLKIKDEDFRPGMKVLVHIPIPAECLEQSDIKIEKTFPEKSIINEADAKARCVAFEETMSENHGFSVTYSYTFTNKYVDAYGKVGGNSELEYNPGEEYVAEEEPHIIFTPYVKALAKKITAGCRDKSVMAKKIYDYLTLNLKYTFMPNYFVMENITDTGLKMMRGDCGVMALMFITLCRAVGVGARWQSGLTMEPTGSGEHDWAEVYLPEFGWRPVDVSYGVAAKRYENEDRRQFYFGNLDPYRMVANKEFMAPLVPEKKWWRDDPYDNQDGEMESELGPIDYVSESHIEVL